MIQDAIAYITDKYAILTDAEKKLADYIILHYEEAMTMSVDKLTQNAGVSPAVAVRLAKHMGFDGFRDFRLYLAQYRPEHEDFILDIKKSESNTQKQVEKVLNASIEAIRLTKDDIDYGILEKACELIKKAEKILLVGTGTSHIVCDDACIKLQRLGKAAFSVCDIHTASVNLAAFSESDLVIAVSHSGENADTINILQIAKALKVNILSLTTFSGTKICSLSDIILYTKTRESPMHRIAITSRISQFATMDALLMAYTVSDYDNCIKHIEKLEAIKKYR